MAARTARSGMRRRPPPCRRCGVGGISGVVISHSWSRTYASTADMRPVTADKPPKIPNETRSKQHLPVEALHAVEVCPGHQFAQQLPQPFAVAFGAGAAGQDIG